MDFSSFLGGGAGGGGESANSQASNTLSFGSQQDIVTILIVSAFALIALVVALKKD